MQVMCGALVPNSNRDECHHCLVLGAGAGALPMYISQAYASWSVTGLFQNVFKIQTKR